MWFEALKFYIELLSGRSNPTGLSAPGPPAMTPGYGLGEPLTATVFAGITAADTRSLEALAEEARRGPLNARQINQLQTILNRYRPPINNFPSELTRREIFSQQPAIRQVLNGGEPWRSMMLAALAADNEIDAVRIARAYFLVTDVGGAISMLSFQRGMAGMIAPLGEPDAQRALTEGRISDFLVRPRLVGGALGVIGGNRRESDEERINDLERRELARIAAAQNVRLPSVDLFRPAEFEGAGTTIAPIQEQNQEREPQMWPNDKAGRRIRNIINSRVFQPDSSILVAMFYESATPQQFATSFNQYYMTSDLDSGVAAEIKQILAQLPQIDFTSPYTNSGGSFDVQSGGAMTIYQPAATRPGQRPLVIDKVDRARATRGIGRTHVVMIGNFPVMTYVRRRQAHNAAKFINGLVSEAGAASGFDCDRFVIALRGMLGRLICDRPVPIEPPCVEVCRCE